ncbi:P60-like protein [Daedaleopsis nitida]|nr:P60-like protein [Daedaleopsis nitida]
MARTTPNTPTTGSLQLNSLTKKASSSTGAPSQRTQNSRKGKRAWRKNVDLDEVEVGLEELRAEERATGSTLQKKKDEELFQIDVAGDDKIRKSLPKFSERMLTSTQILSQRSAVPAVFSRPTSSAFPKAGTKRKAATHDEKSRLLKMGKRLRRGPFNAFVDPDQVGEGSAMLELSEAAKQAGTYDVWAEETPERVDVKGPKTQPLRSNIELAAVPSPHEGSSYNPPVTSHQDLLRTAHEKEELKLKEAEQLEEIKARMEKARTIAREDQEAGMARGMKLEASTELEEEEQEGGKKAERLRAEKRALAEKAARKRMLASVDSAKSLRKAISRNLAMRERLRSERQLALQAKFSQGLAGQKVGKHKVPEGQIAVQLGEELSESLRALKPEGNLFKDRFVSMQQRALVEPRAAVPAKKQARKTKEYEKHSYKKFDRAY